MTRAVILCRLVMLKVRHGSKIPIQSPARERQLQYKHDVPMPARYVRFSPNKTFATRRPYDLVAAKAVIQSLLFA